MTAADDVPASHDGITLDLDRDTPVIAHLQLSSSELEEEPVAVLSRALDRAFEELAVHTVVWHSVAGDLASWRVAWACGFTFGGTSRQTEPRRGELLDGWTATLVATDTRQPKTTWLPAPRLTDGHATLRPLVLADERRYLESVLDADSDLWLSEVPMARDSAAFARNVRDGGLSASLGAAVQWAIADATSDEYVGGMALFGFNGLDYRSAEVGYRAHPSARGRGYVSAALRLALGQAFVAEDEGGYGRQRVSLGAAYGNDASQAVARACGFTETGRDRRCYRLADDRVVDLVRFDLLADEWQRR